MNITKEDLKKYKANYESAPTNKVMENVLSKNDITKCIKINSTRSYNRPKFEIDIKTLSATNQYSSGRCWIFAGLNVLREIVAKECNLSEFELSQNFVAFYDKLEKINFKLENIIELCTKDYDDRTLSCILFEGIQDGGQWDMFVNIVKKYGVVPKDVYDETYQSNNTRQMNYVIATSIRKFASKASVLAKEGKIKEIRDEKNSLLAKLYNFLCMGFGEPVEEFDFEYVDKDGKYLSLLHYSSFAQKLLTILNPEKKINISNAIIK